MGTAKIALWLEWVRVFDRASCPRQNARTRVVFTPVPAEARFAISCAQPSSNAVAIAARGARPPSEDMSAVLVIGGRLRIENALA